MLSISSFLISLAFFFVSKNTSSYQIYKHPINNHLQSTKSAQNIHCLCHQYIFISSKFKSSSLLQMDLKPLWILFKTLHMFLFLFYFFIVCGCFCYGCNFNVCSYGFKFWMIFETFGIV